MVLYHGLSTGRVLGFELVILKLEFSISVVSYPDIHEKVPPSFCAAIWKVNSSSRKLLMTRSVAHLKLFLRAFCRFHCH